MTLVANITVDITEAFDSIQDVNVPSSSQGVAVLKSFIPGRNVGGGILIWDASMDRAKHNGITILSPSAVWDGTYAGLPAYRASGKSGTGCWVRQYGTYIMASWAGVDTTGVWIMDEPMRAAAILAGQLSKDLRVDSGTIKSGFSSKVQYRDKFNLFVDTSVVLENLNNLRIFAEHDVEVNTDGTGLERVVFFLRNCRNCTIEGFNWNSSFTDYSIQPTDTTHRIQEDWKGVVIEGGTEIKVSKNQVNACRVFALSDVTNLSTPNGVVRVLDCSFKYVTNYCVLSRNTDFVQFDRCKVSHNGRTWHTFGEAVAVTTGTLNVQVNHNEFRDQIAQQSCITPTLGAASVHIADNYCHRRYGIFVEMGSSSNVSIVNNVSVSVGERADTPHVLMVGPVDGNPADGLANLLIQGNRFVGGGFAVQEYNTGGVARTGFIISDNHFVDCRMPSITNSSYSDIQIRSNYMEAPSNFPDMALGGTGTVVQGNVLKGVRLRARDLGYTVVGLKVIGNTFIDNGAGTFPALIDYTDLQDLSAYDNDSTRASYNDFIVHPANMTRISFVKVGATEGFIVSPSDRFDAKIQSQRLGATVLNSTGAAATYGYTFTGSVWGRIALA